MRMTFDHDFHIHSELSSCSSDPLQTPEAILQYAKDNGLRKICLTDHFWDEDVPFPSDWYRPQNFAHVSRALPLPKDPDVKYYFGCETDMDKLFRLGISQYHFDKFDFVIIPTTHLHMKDFTIAAKDYLNVDRRRELFVERFRALLNMDLPFEKVGVAHLTCSLMDGMGEDNFRVSQEIIASVPDETYKELFTKAAAVGIGIELNTPIESMSPEEQEIDIRPYRLAKECGCKFYFGTDAHHPDDFLAAQERFNLLIDLLDLQEEDRFDPFK